MIGNISELEKGNGKLYTMHGNLDITMACLKTEDRKNMKESRKR